MKSRLDCGHFPSKPFGFFHRARHPGRLPTHDLPFTVALEEGSAVQIARYGDPPVLLGLADQAEGDYRRIAVLLNPNVFGAVSGCRVSGLRRRSRPLATHNIRLADPSPG